MCNALMSVKIKSMFVRILSVPAIKKAQSSDQ